MKISNFLDGTEALIYDFGERGFYNRRPFMLGDELDMLIDEQFRKCVAFLLADLNDQDSGKLRRTPVATTFFIGVSLEDVHFIYAVTARHVIECSRQYGPLYIRVNLPTTGYKDFSAPQEAWTAHWDTDIAICPVALGDAPPDIKTIPRELFVTDKYIKKEKISPGDDVFFVGLFSPYPGIERNQPIVRFGNISLMPHEKIPIKNPWDSTEALIDAYLVEARSWGGQSGSPAFVYFPPDRTPGVLKVGGVPFALLGLVHGHYEIKQEVAFIGDILGSGKVPINAGMALVIPSQKIIELLDSKEFVEQRKRALETIRKNRPVPHPD